MMVGVLRRRTRRRGACTRGVRVDAADEGADDGEEVFEWVSESREFFLGGSREW